MRELARAICAQPWAVLPETLAALAALADAQLEGRTPSAAAIEAAGLGVKPRTTSTSTGAIRVLPLFGLITQHGSLFSWLFGGTSTEEFGAELQEAIVDSRISAIVIPTDSPGGEVNGVEELADRIFAARRVKPVVAVAHSMAASAAYWLATQASEFVVTPSGKVGSVGIIARHDDLSGAAEKAGVRRTFVVSAPRKAELHPFAPPDSEGLAYLQEMVDAYHRKFVAAVARGRRKPPAVVDADFGQGRLVLASRSVALDMADREDTLGRVIRGLASEAGRERAMAHVRHAEQAIRAARARFELARVTGGDQEARRRRELESQAEEARREAQGRAARMALARERLALEKLRRPGHRHE